MPNKKLLASMHLLWERNFVCNRRAKKLVTKCHSKILQATIVPTRFAKTSLQATLVPCSHVVKLQPNWNYEENYFHAFFFLTDQKNYEWHTDCIKCQFGVFMQLLCQVFFTSNNFFLDIFVEMLSQLW